MARRRLRLAHVLATLDPPVLDIDEAIAENRVLVDGAITANPNSMVLPDARIRVLPRKQPRGVTKLGHALDALELDVVGAVGLDVGACTGGFTRALLDRGAARVHAVDVGYGQLVGSLRQDPRVRNYERTNVADVTPELLGERPDVIVVDVTKLSLRDAAEQLADNDVPASGSSFVGLVKPMFELHQGVLPTSVEDLDRACELAASGLADAGWTVVQTIDSAVRGHNGAVEFFVHARWE